MLFTRHILDRITAGEVDLAYRSWRRPTVRAGSRLRTAAGVVHIDEIEVIDPAAITGEDARRAGFPSRDALVATLPGDPRLEGRDVYRIRLHMAGPDPRVALREAADLDVEDVAHIAERLHRLDRSSRRGPWTRATLELIRRRPGVRAGDLAAEVDRPRDRFKADVRKLKELGLTESLEIGYRLSARGETFLAASGDTPPGDC